MGIVICTLVMALRVLLADESSTIKKAIQMALAEFAVDVKSVPSGLDVLTVALTYQPDVVLADVLLTKKNGYDVCHELKADPTTRNVPVILMWSSFMQIDQAQVKKVRADGILEKPFDTETLRSLIEKFVPKTNSFPLKGFLNSVKLPDFTESETFVRQKSDYDSLFNNDESLRKNNIEDVEEDFSFDPRPSKTGSPLNQGPENSDEWSAASANQFVIETESFGDFEEVTVIDSKAEGSTRPELQKRINEQVNSYLKDAPLARNKAAQEMNLSSKAGSHFDEQILKEEIRQMAERICWQIIPDITEKVVREELNKLLQGLEKNT